MKLLRGEVDAMTCYKWVYISTLHYVPGCSCGWGKVGKMDSAPRKWGRWTVLHASGAVGMELTGRNLLELRVLGVMTKERVY